MVPILGNKSPICSTEVPIDRSHPGAQLVKFPRIAIHLNRRDWPSK
jgi:hypothetical protein